MTISPVSPWEAAARLFEPQPPRPRRWASPLDLAQDLDRTVVRTPALDVINRDLVQLADTPHGANLAVFMSPQEGKSTTCSYWHPLWLLVDDPDRRIIIISYSAEMARRWGADIKLALETFNGDEGTIDLELRLRADSRAAGRWQVDGHRGGIYCAGIGGQITGRPADYIVVDDPLKGLKEAQSAAFRNEVMRTWQGSIVPRRAPGTKVVWIQTLWHEDEAIQQILAVEGADWQVVRIPAVAETPDDPLGRDVGEPMQSARGDRNWTKIRTSVGEYVWSALYQQRPSPAEGGLFKRLWWRYWSAAPSLGTGDRIDLAGRVWPLSDCWRFATVDLAASTRTSADWTVAAAWAMTLDGDLVLLDRVRAHVGEGQHFSLLRPLHERWGLDTAFVERSQYGTTLAADAARTPGMHLTPVDADTDKFTRALPYSARCSGGRVWLPAGASWLSEWVDEHAAFPNGTNDDQVDTGSYAARVAVSRTAPALPRERRPSNEVDFLTVAM